MGIKKKRNLLKYKVGIKNRKLRVKRKINPYLVIMEFAVKTINESLFKETLNKIVEENNILSYSQMSTQRNGNYSTLILEDVFIDRMKMANPNAINELLNIK